MAAPISFWKNPSGRTSRSSGWQPVSRASSTWAVTPFWLDLCPTGAEEGFAPASPFDLVEMQAGKSLPRVYAREELLDYLEICRQRCRETLEALSTEQAYRICRFPWGEVPFGELLLYVLRHVQEHAAKLHMFLLQQRSRAA